MNNDELGGITADIAATAAEEQATIRRYSGRNNNKWAGMPDPWLMVAGM